MPSRVRTNGGCSPHRWAALGLFLCMTWGSSAALSPDKATREFRHTAWFSKDGAPSAILGFKGMAQDRDGYLWLASSVGLTRFDGARFERHPLPHDPRLASESATSLFAPASGGLWVGFTYGGVGFLKDDKFVLYPDVGGLPLSTAESFAEADDGSLWVATGTGLARFDGRSWTRIEADDYPRPPDTVSMLIDSEGTVWLVTAGRLYTMPRGGRALTQVDSNYEISALAEASDGTLWVEDQSALRPLRRLTRTPSHPLSTGTGLMFDRAGALWSIDFHGLHRITPRELNHGDAPILGDRISNTAIDESGGLTSSTPAQLLEDREGNLWTFTQNGLDRLSETKLVHELGRTYSPATNRHLFQPLLVADGNRLWTSGESGAGVLLLTDGKVVPQPVGPGLVAAGCLGRDGSVFIAVPTGIYRFKSGAAEMIPYPDSVPSAPIQSMVEDRRGDLWISVIQDRVYRRVAGRWIAYGGLATLPAGFATVISSDSGGRLWLGYRTGRVAVVEGTTVTFFQTRKGIGGIQAIYGMRSRSWVGGTSGLAVLDGSELRDIESQSAGDFRGVSGIVETAAGDVWLNGAAGLVQIPAAELARNSTDHLYKVKTVVMAAIDGVSGIEERLRPLPTLAEAADGRLWFSTSSEVYSTDPIRGYRNAVAPSVVMRSVIADGRVYDGHGRVELPVHTRNLEIDFVGISLTLAEKVRYRHMLVGVDDGWQETGMAGHQAFYTNLNPGHYRFEVDAANNDGVWNERATSLEISIPPAYNQTAWFTAMWWTLAFGTLPAVIALHSWVRGSRAAARARERMNERERIARDLHDTLIQDIEALSLNLRALQHTLGPHALTRNQIARLDTSAQRALESARDRVSDLRTRVRDAHYLKSVLDELAQNLAVLYPTAFRVQVEGSPLRLESAASEEVVAIGREAVLNAFRHARARTIVVSLIYGRRLFELRVVDDGKGLDTQQSGEEGTRAHWGLVGMRERAGKLRADLFMDAAAGGGTTVRLRVPAHIAYADDQISRFTGYWLYIRSGFSRAK